MTVVAIYGGSFNPPHVAHQLASLLVLETVAVDELWWVPTHKHPFGKTLAPWSHRLEMCRLATRRLGAQVRVSEIEAQLGGESNRTLHTLQSIAATDPTYELRLVVGADILAESAAWYRWDEIVELAPPIVIARAGFELGTYAASALPEVPAISSTAIRDKLARGETAAPLVPRSVMDYIAAHRLYR